MSGLPPTLGIVSPCYNEQEVIPHSITTLVAFISELIEAGTISSSSLLMLVDDGSRDSTLSISLEAAKLGKGRVRVLELNRNYGHQNAILAGMLSLQTEVDCVVTLDIDLQDDIQVIPEMLLRFAEGAEVVFGVRNSRDSDTFFKKSSARCFYKLMQLLGVPCVYDHADFRLLSSRVVSALGSFEERNLFLRALIYQMGFSSAVVKYDRKERELGESKYPLRKMLSFAWNGITSFSIAPLRLISLAGIFFFLAALVGVIWVVISNIRDLTVPGWSSLAVIILFIGGVQLVSIGVLGEYLGKIYLEVKRRPRYQIANLYDGRES